MTNPFAPASKAKLKARIALCGPTGSGKTWTALEWAAVLADGGPIALIDTEHGSASLYADHCKFDTMPWAPPYNPTALAETVAQVPAWGYSVLIVDSLSHFWMGEGGTIDVADNAASRFGGNSFAGWKVATPALRHLVDSMLAVDCHVIVTMRTKTEWIIEEDSRGKKAPRKIGLAPVMRDGIEYEFTLIGDMDLEHRVTVSKSRCSLLADKVIQPGRAAEAAATFAGWLSDGSGDAATPVEMIPVAEAKNRLISLLGSTELAAEAWGDRGSTPISEAELEAIVESHVPPSKTEADQ